MSGSGVVSGMQWTLGVSGSGVCSGMQWINDVRQYRV